VSNMKYFEIDQRLFERVEDLMFLGRLVAQVTRSANAEIFQRLVEGRLAKLLAGQPLSARVTQEGFVEFRHNSGDYVGIAAAKNGETS